MSTNVLASGNIEFNPELPKRQLDAAAKLSLGSYDHIAFELPGNPLGLLRDDLVFEKSTARAPPRCSPMCRARSLHLVEVGGSFGRDLSAQGRARR